VGTTANADPVALPQGHRPSGCRNGARRRGQFQRAINLDRSKGVFSRPSHKLVGHSYADRILVLDTAKGGVATAWMLHDMMARGIVPRALIFNRVNPILAQGAAFGNVALVDRFDCDVTRIFRTGDELRIDPAAGFVEILNRNA
jgi:predicted aconitase with swiveling domain